MGGPGTSSIPVSSSNPLYTISMSDGSRQIQNGGSTPRPSLVSSLTIDVTDESVAGEYVCSGPSSFQTIVLNVQGGINNNAHSHGLSFHNHASNHKVYFFLLFRVNEFPYYIY